MKMYLWLCFVSLLASVNAFPADQSIDRDKRSLYITWRLVMFGAKPCGFCEHRLIRKVYMQSGGLDKAKADFEMLDPKDIKIYPDGAKTGSVGDRLVHLEVGEVPSLYVSGSKATTSHGKGKGTEIFYFKHFPEKDNKNWEFIKQ